MTESVTRSAVMTEPFVTPEYGIYAKYIKRPMDFFLSLLALSVLSPILLIVTAVTAIAMRGNPFFTQERPGKNEKIFKLIKFRTMTCETDGNGQLLPDGERLTKYGKFLRSTSIDELPELINILKGDMSVVGPRPLLKVYLSRYNERQRHRHDVRPGLSGLAQVNGRNHISWEEKFEDDIIYISNITFWGDIKIIFKTVFNVLKREGISQEGEATASVFLGTEEKVTAVEK